MSVRQMALVWEHEFSRSEQAIMLALTDHASDDGTRIFPSIARIAWKTDYSERQVKRIIKTLTKNEVLVLVCKASRHRPNEYRVDWTAAKPKDGFRGDITVSPLDGEESRGDTMTPLEKSGVTSGASRGDISRSRGDKTGFRSDIAVSPEPSVKPSFEPSDESSGISGGPAPPIDEPFLEAWGKYFPNKSQPRPKTYEKKIRARLRNPDFKKRWREAMEKASRSSYLQNEGWFQFRYFVKNDEKFQMILDGAFDGFDRGRRQSVRESGKEPRDYEREREERKNKKRAELAAKGIRL